MRNSFHFDESAEEFYLYREQDVEPVLAQNQEMRKSDDGYTQDRTIKRVGRIPMVVIEKIITEDGWNPLAAENAERLLQLLDDPDYSKFKTSDGRSAHVARRHFYRGSASTKLVRGDDQ